MRYGGAYSKVMSLKNKYRRLVFIFMLLRWGNSKPQIATTNIPKLKKLLNTCKLMSVMYTPSQLKMLSKLIESYEKKGKLTPFQKDKAISLHKVVAERWRVEMLGKKGIDFFSFYNNTVFYAANKIDYIAKLNYFFTNKLRDILKLNRSKKPVKESRFMKNETSSDPPRFNLKLQKILDNKCKPQVERNNYNQLSEIDKKIIKIREKYGDQHLIDQVPPGIATPYSNIHLEAIKDFLTGSTPQKKEVKKFVAEKTEGKSVSNEKVSSFFSQLLTEMESKA